ncbi:MAG: NADH-quinone oxidoreductase subunit NuoG [Fimbriimonadaceae bacterium]|jgi:NADH-quinone oxidoreductase subunit G|nr:NADH-quinone oxidoreductase subunit NuoG [Fimbriimonadaceae bacterium]
MAAVVSTDTVKVTINGVEIEVPKGELIVESVKRLGLEIPIFCYHPRMKPVGMCRMCLVEVGFKQPDGSVRMMPKPQAGCTLPASDNMVVLTDTEAIHRDRKGVLEFLLINHPLDCPICDRGGECPLQNNTLSYGPSTSRFIEMKRHAHKAFPLSQYVTLDLERCIQCGRCVRFTEEISGDSQLAFRFRGASMQPATYQLTDFESKFSGNVIEICPVGALTNAKYRFRARPWDLETKPGICTVTPCGTNVWFDYRAGKFIRLNGRTNEEVNEEWTADRTKFGHDFYNSPNRLKAPNLRTETGFKGAGWSDVYAEILAHFEGKGSEVGVITEANLSNEDLFMLQKLFRKGFASQNIDHRLSGGWQSFEERLENKLGLNTVQTTIAELENVPASLVFATSLADEQPMTFLRLRKGWFQNGTKVISATSHPTEVDQFAHVILRYKPGTEARLAAGLAHASGAALEGLEKFNPEATEQATGVPANLIREAGEILREAGARILTTHSLLTTSEGSVACEILAGLAHKAGHKFSCLGLKANTAGAKELGLLPDTLPGGIKNSNPGKDTRQMLEDAARGKLKALWLVNCDPLTDFPDRDLAEKALENVEFLVVQHHQAIEACEYASVVLPMTLPAEQDGTFTSSERRVQRMAPVLSAPGEAKASWRIFAELLLRIQPSTPPFGPKDVMEEISREVPTFAGVNYGALDGPGVLIAQPELGEPNLNSLGGTLSKV